MDIKTADRLVELRKSHGFSQEALSEKLGVSRQAISKWERGESSPDTDNLIALANIYGITLDELIVGKKETKEPEKKEERKPAPLANVAKNLFKFPIPIIIIVSYVAFNLVFKLWHPSWLVFFLLPIYYHFAGICFIRSKKAFLLALPIPEIIVLLYLVLGFIFSKWAIGAFVFIIIPIYYWVVAFYKKK